MDRRNPKLARRNTTSGSAVVSTMLYKSFPRQKEIVMTASEKMDDCSLYIGSFMVNLITITQYSESSKTMWQRDDKM